MELLTVQDAADQLGCGHHKITNAIKTGQLKAQRLGKRSHAIQKHHLDEYAATLKAPAFPAFEGSIWDAISKLEKRVQYLEATSI